MKRICLFLLIAIVGMSTIRNASAKIWRVNNNPNKSCDFKDAGSVSALTLALRSSLVKEGDTLHIEGSSKGPYGKDNSATGVTMDTVRKRLVIIGPGFLLDKNSETQHNKYPARFYSLYIVPAAAGTIIAGLEQMPSNMIDDGANGAGATVNIFTGNSAYAPVTRSVSTDIFNKYVYSGVWPFYDEATNTQYNANGKFGNINGCVSNVAIAQARCWNQNTKYKLMVNANNVTISHNKLYFLELYNTDTLRNITVTKCFFNPGLIACRASDKPVINLIISNNFFRNDGVCLGYGTYNGTRIDNNYTNSNVSLSGPVQATSYLVIDLRGKGKSAAPWPAAEYLSAYAWNEDRETYYNRFTWPVVNPTIQNNTFYHAFNIAAKAARLSNNLFYPGWSHGTITHAEACYGLPTQFGPVATRATVAHDTKDNIILNNTLWTNQSRLYGGMASANGTGDVYESTNTNWFVSPGTWYVDNSFALNPGSPPASAETAKQHGMYGGLAPYILSGLYTIPAVWEITIPGGNEVPSTGFEVRVKVKSH